MCRFAIRKIEKYRFFTYLLATRLGNEGFMYLFDLKWSKLQQIKLIMTPKIIGIN
jgi:hypothetical protein